jgi:hypothetical protein
MKLEWTRRELQYNTTGAAQGEREGAKKRGEPKLPSRKNIRLDF